MLGTAAAAEEAGAAAMAAPRASGAAAPAAKESESERRVRLLSDAVSGLAAEEKVAAVSRLAGRCTAEERGELVHALVRGGGGAGAAVAVLGAQMGRLPLLERMQVMSESFQACRSDEQLKTLHLLCTGLGPEQRMQLAADAAAPCDEAARSALARRLLQALHAAERQQGVGLLLEALPREDRMACLEAALLHLPNAEFKRLTLEHASRLQPEQRKGLFSGMMGEATHAEREALVSEQLVSMRPDERGPLLTELMGTMLQGEKAALLEACRSPE